MNNRAGTPQTAMNQKTRAFLTHIGLSAALATASIPIMRWFMISYWHQVCAWPVLLTAAQYTAMVFEAALLTCLAMLPWVYLFVSLGLAGLDVLKLANHALLPSRNRRWSGTGFGK